MHGNLIVSRHKGETIKIGPDIFVTVADIRGDKVRLAVQADKDVRVDRLEIAMLRDPHAVDNIKLFLPG